MRDDVTSDKLTRSARIGIQEWLLRLRFLAVGVSGDGDSGSIGMGQFKHMMRRNVRMVYIVENNGVKKTVKRFSIFKKFIQDKKCL